jgi:hypothetical protein
MNKSLRIFTISGDNRTENKMPPLEIPRPKPQDVPSPVPESAQKTVLKMPVLDINESPNPGGQGDSGTISGPGLASVPSGDDLFEQVNSFQGDHAPIPEGAPAPDDHGTTPAPTGDELFNQVNNSLVKSAARDAADHIYSGPFLQMISDRLQTSFGRDATEQAEILKKTHPGRKVEVKGDEVYLDDFPYHAWPGSGQKGEDFLKGMAGKVADWIPGLLEMGLSYLTHKGITEIKPDSAILPTLGIGAGVLAGDELRASAANMAGADSANPVDSLPKASLDAIVSMGLDGVLRGLYGTIASPDKTQIYADHLRALETLHKRIEPLKDPEAMAASMLNLLENEKARLNRTLEMNKDVVRNLPGSKNLIPSTYVQALKDILESQGVTIPPPAPGMNSVRAALPSRASALRPFGSPRGQEHLEEMINHFNEIQKGIENGGFEMDDFFNWNGANRRMSDILSNERSPNFDDSMSGVYKTLERASAQDRDEQALKIFEKNIGDSSDHFFLGDPKYQFGQFKIAYEEYRNKIEAIKTTIGLMKNEKSNSVLMDIMKAGQPKDIAILKSVFSSVPGQWEDVSGQWMAEIVDSFIDQDSGKFNSKGFLDYLKAVPQ